MTLFISELKSASFKCVAANTLLDPAVVVIAGKTGIMAYSIDERENEDGFDVYTFQQAERATYGDINGIDCYETSGLFVAGGPSGLLLKSNDGAAWVSQSLGTTENVLDVAHVSGDIWLAVCGGGEIYRSTDGSITWAAVTSNTSKDLNAAAAEGANVVAVGADGAVVLSTNSGATWAAKASGTTEDLYGVCYGPASKWAIVGDGTILQYDGNNGFTLGSLDGQADFRGVAWAGGSGGLLLAAGSGAKTFSSVNGLTWSKQESGSTSEILNAVEYIDSRFMAVGDNGKICYSASGTGVRQYQNFVPVSEIYRATAFGRLGGTMVYLGIYELEGNEWVYYPRRWRSPVPGTVNNFDIALGAQLGDFPGDGAVIAAANIEGGVVVGEQNQISLLTDGGSVQTPWRYNDNYGDGLQLISNLATFNGAAFGICTDGLIYRADYNSTQRLGSMFDLTKFDDFNPGTERVTIQFDPMTQKLLVFRPESPWTIFLVDDEDGSVTTFTLPEFSESGSDYTPRSVVVAAGEISGMKVTYSTDDEAQEKLVTLDFQYDAAILGGDQSFIGFETHFYGEIITGCFRVQRLGVRGEMAEILVRTNCDPDSTARPRMAVGVKAEPEDDWQYAPGPGGTITADKDTLEVTGVGTAFSNIIATGDDVTTDFVIPWLVEKVTRCFWRSDFYPAIPDVELTYTKIAAREIRLSAPLAGTGVLYVYGGIGLPRVRGEDGVDLLEYPGGIITIAENIQTATLMLPTYLDPSTTSEVEYIPAIEMPAGDERGDGKLIFGLGRGFDQIMIRIVIVPWVDNDGKWAKVTGIELGYRPTGPEMKTDGG